MNRLNTSKGFGTVETILFILICAIIGGTGYYVLNSNKSISSNLTNNTATVSSSSYLNIKEWGVKIRLTAPIKDATYHLASSSRALISTASLDAIAACSNTSSVDNTNNWMSYQEIDRYALAEIVPRMDSPDLSAQQLAKAEPQYYKEVGNYVYGYTHGNGQPCAEQTTQQTLAFNKLLSTMVAD